MYIKFNNVSLCYTNYAIRDEFDRFWNGASPAAASPIYFPTCNPRNPKQALALLRGAFPKAKIELAHGDCPENRFSSKQVPGE